MPLLDTSKSKITTVFCGYTNDVETVKAFQEKAELNYLLIRPKFLFIVYWRGKNQNMHNRLRIEKKHSKKGKYNH